MNHKKNALCNTKISWQGTHPKNNPGGDNKHELTAPLLLLLVLLFDNKFENKYEIINST